MKRLIDSDWFVVGLLLWGSALGLPNSSLHPTVMKWLIVLAGIAWFACFGSWLVVTIMSEEFSLGCWTVSRSENPVRFWICITLEILAAAALTMGFMDALAIKGQTLGAATFVERGSRIIGTRLDNHRMSE